MRSGRRSQTPIATDIKHNRKVDKKMKEILKCLHEKLETATYMKNSCERKADQFAKGSSAYRSLKEDERFADGLIRGLEIAIETIKE